MALPSVHSVPHDERDVSCKNLIILLPGMPIMGDPCMPVDVESPEKGGSDDKLRHGAQVQQMVRIVIWNTEPVAPDDGLIARRSIPLMALRSPNIGLLKINHVLQICWSF